MDGVSPFFVIIKPCWPGKQKYKFDYVNTKNKGEILMPQGCGTHIDSPFHFYKNKKDIAAIPIQNFVASTCVIDISRNASLCPDYVLTVSDIINWENGYGDIPEKNVILINTG